MRNVRQIPSVESLAREVGNILWHGQPTGITDPAQLQRLRADRTGYPDRPTFSEYMQSVAWLIWNGSV